ncbi:MAG: cytochrome c biogenesis protein ResB [Thermodesulfobacteriota bacterium]
MVDNNMQCSVHDSPKKRFGLRSIRLTILLSLLIVIITAIGSMIVIREPEPFNELTSGILFPWILNEGGTYLSSIWWILLLLILIALIGLNTIICTIDRIKTLADKKRYETGWLSKRMIYPLFPHLVHIGLFIAVMGHLISSIYGFKTWNNIIVEGEKVAIPLQENRYIRLDGIEEAYSDNGGLLSVKATVSVFDGMNKQIDDGIVDINRPFFYKGIAFYHSHHGQTTTGLILEFNGKTYRVNLGESFRLLDGRTIKLGRLFSDFALDAKGNPYNRSGRPVNPVQELLLTDNNTTTVSTGWLSVKNPGYEARLGDLKIKLAGYATSPYLVMAINKDPGAKIVLIGSSIFMTGFILLLLLRKERRELIIKNHI